MWFVIEVTVDFSAAEAVEFAFNELDATGTEINNLGKNATEAVTIIGYFSEQPADEIVLDQLNEALRIYGFAPSSIKNTRRRTLGDVDWLYEWKKHWRPTKVGRFVVAPTWYEIEESAGETIIWIDPAMAFGTGTHATTQLCLKAIGENFQSDMSFLDVGTGTGILAIAAAKLKTDNPHLKIVGCDTDEDSVKIARENAEMNGAADKIEFFAGSISDDTPAFDFVCANLTADVIVPLLPLLTRKAKRILVLSGILREQEDLIIAELKKFQIENPKIETLGEWISIFH
ncbi:MAG TPA: 50S ribosomal protein L11 methyltransferase [Pyrinomonadaceae bacterium]|jgi:ribosomal protein L11 methyltransferase